MLARAAVLNDDLQAAFENYQFARFYQVRFPWGCCTGGFRLDTPGSLAKPPEHPRCLARAESQLLMQGWTRHADTSRGCTVPGKS